MKKDEVIVSEQINGSKERGNGEDPGSDNGDYHENSKGNKTNAKETPAT